MRIFVSYTLLFLASCVYQIQSVDELTRFGGDSGDAPGSVADARTDPGSGKDGDPSGDNTADGEGEGVQADDDIVPGECRFGSGGPGCSQCGDPFAQDSAGNCLPLCDVSEECFVGASCTMGRESKICQCGEGYLEYINAIGDGFVCVAGCKAAALECTKCNPRRDGTRCDCGPNQVDRDGDGVCEPPNPVNDSGCSTAAGLTYCPCTEEQVPQPNGTCSVPCTQQCLTDGQSCLYFPVPSTDPVVSATARCGRVLYVVGDSVVAQPGGTSWDDAFNTLGAALEKLADDSSFDTIYIRGDLYEKGPSFVPANVTIMGGFGEDQTDAVDWLQARATGDLPYLPRLGEQLGSGAVGPTQLSKIRVSLQLSDGVSLAGVKLMGSRSSSGAALSLASTGRPSVYLRSVWVDGITDGSVFSVNSAGTIDIQDSLFTSNEGGAGIYLLRVRNTLELRISRSAFVGNINAPKGVVDIFDTPTVITDSFFSANSGGSVGSISARLPSLNKALRIERCVFTDNTAAGPLIEISLPSVTVNNVTPSAEIYSSLFVNNIDDANGLLIDSGPVLRAIRNSFIYDQAFKDSVATVVRLSNVPGHEVSGNLFYSSIPRSVVAFTAASKVSGAANRYVGLTGDCTVCGSVGVPLTDSPTIFSAPTSAMKIEAASARVNGATWRRVDTSPDFPAGSFVRFEGDDRLIPVIGGSSVLRLFEPTATSLTGLIAQRSFRPLFGSALIDSGFGPGSGRPRYDLEGRYSFDILSILNTGSAVPAYTDVGCYELRQR